MSKLSIGQHGIQVETHEKSNVMTPFHNIFYVIGAVSVVLLICGNETWIKIFGAALFILYALAWIIIYSTHSIKNPELLQSEVYRLEMQKIESGMIENKTEDAQKLAIETIKTNLIEVVPDSPEGDSYVS